MIYQAAHSVYPIIIPTKSNLISYNFYLLQEADSLTLIDAGIDSEMCWAAFSRTLSENGFTVDDLSQIILTHNHSDHIGLVNRICSMKDIPVYAHTEAIHRLKRDEEFFHMRIGFFNQLYQEMGCGALGLQQVEKLKVAVEENKHNTIKADITPMSDSDHIAGLQVIEAPGHSQDHIILLHNQSKLIFAGDLLIKHMASNAIVEPDRNGNRVLSLIQNIDSLQKCLYLQAESALSGHGDPIYNPTDIIRKQLHKIQLKSGRILSLIEAGIPTAHQLANSLYKEGYPGLFSLIMSDIIGHLDNLIMLGRIQKQMSNGVWHYSTV